MTRFKNSLILWLKVNYLAGQVKGERSMTFARKKQLEDNRIVIYKFHIEESLNIDTVLQSPETQCQTSQTYTIRLCADMFAIHIAFSLKI